MNDKQMLPFLHDDLLKLVNNVFLLIMFTRASRMLHCDWIEKIKLTNKDNVLKAKEVNLGFGTRKSITDLKKSDVVSAKDHAAFINDYISFITVIIYKLFDRSLISFVIIRNFNALNSNKITCREDEILQEKMKAILKHFVNLEIFSPLTWCKVLEQHTQFLEEVKRVNSHELRNFKTWEKKSWWFLL